MEYKDYYKILGVAKTATADEIKKAFRKLAVKYHPDKNAGNKQMEEKFKEINEANEVLGDTEKRKKYDELGANWQQYGGASHGFTGQRNAQQRQGGNAGGNDFGFGGGNFSDFFEQFFGGRFGGDAFNGGSTRAAKGQDMRLDIQLTLEEAYTGTMREFQVDGEKLRINLKPGSYEGQQIRIKGKGGHGKGSGQRGDIYGFVTVLPHAHFKLKGSDVYCEAPVEFYTAVLGGKATIRTLKGLIKIDITKETENGKVLRLKKMGMPVYNEPGKMGDLYATVNIMMPKNLSQKEMELFNELAALRKQQ